MARVVCASREIEPNDIAPVENRLTMSLADFDLFERNRLAAILRGVPDAEQAADGQQVLLLLVQHLGEGAILVLGAAANRVLQQRHRFGGPGMRFAAQPHRIFAADLERVAQHRRGSEGVGVATRGLLGDLVEAGAFDRRRSAEEEAVDERARQADGVENLRAAVRLVGRDAHLRHDLQQALVDRLDEALDDLVGADLLGKTRRHRRQGLEGQIGVDRLGAVAGQAGEMMDFTRFAGLDDEADRRAQPLADEVMMHRRHRQQRGDRDAVGADHPVGQDDDVVAAVHGDFGALAQARQRLLHAARALFDVIGDVERLGVERILKMADAADLLEVLVGEDRLAHFEALLLGVAGRIEQVGARPDERHEAHDELLADRVDRRIGDLREILLEIAVEQLRAIGQRRDRRVGAHRADGFLAGRGHRREQHRQVLLRIAEGLLAIEQRDVGARGARLDGLEVLQDDLGVLQPGAIGIGARQRLLDLAVGDDAVLDQIDQQHLARLQAPLGDDLFLGHRQHAHFGRHDDEIVVGDEIARGPQAVAVQRRADLAPVGEGDRRRAVPRLHHRSVIFVEVAPLLVHQRIARPRLGDQHHHRVGQRIAALHEKLERIVETRGVRLPFVGNRPQLGNVVAEQPGGDAGLARRHPVHIAAQRVDLAVVRDHPVGMSEPPGRERVGGETLVDERQRGVEPRVQQVGVIGRELADQHHPLVDDGPARHRDGIIFGEAAGARQVDAVGDDLAQDEQPALEVVLVDDVAASTDEQLTLGGLDRLDPFAEVVVVDGNVAPADQGLALLDDHFFDDLFDQGARRAVARHEELADRIMAGRGQRQAEPVAFGREEGMRNLDENAAAVAELGVGAGRPAMVEVDENLQALLQDVVRLAVAKVGDETDAAGIVLPCGVVKALAARQKRIGHGGSPRIGDGSNGSGGGGFAAAGAVGGKLAGGLAFHLSAPFARPRLPGRSSSNCGGAVWTWTAATRRSPKGFTRRVFFDLV